MKFLISSESVNAKMLKKARQLKAEISTARDLNMSLKPETHVEFSEAGIDISGLRVSLRSDLSEILHRTTLRIVQLESIVEAESKSLFTIDSPGTMYAVLGILAAILIFIIPNCALYKSLVSNFRIDNAEARFCSSDQLRISWNTSENASGNVFLPGQPLARCDRSDLTTHHEWVAQSSSCGQSYIAENSGGGEFAENTKFRIEINSRNGDGENRTFSLDAVSPKKACLCIQSVKQPDNMSCKHFQCDLGLSFSKGPSSNRDMADLFFEDETLPDGTIEKVFMVAPAGIRIIEDKRLCDISSGSTDGLVNRVQIYGPSGYLFNTRSASFLVKSKNGGLFKLGTRGKGPFRIAQESNGSMMMVGLYLDWYGSEPDNSFKN